MHNTINQEVRDKTIQRARHRKIILPTLAQQKNPADIPSRIKDLLREIGLWDVHPLNLFRITWKNEPVEQGGGFGEGNWIEFPSELTGVDAKIVGLVGKWFPTGAHKVGAAYGCLIPPLVTGGFDPETQKAVWPSTGNFCRGGAYDCALLGCPAVAILPDGMSRERFEWLSEIGTDEIIATPGTESNVKEIYDQCHTLKATRGDAVMIFNQFSEFGNAVWHYHVTGNAVYDVYRKGYASKQRLAGFVSATGSAGTLAAGDFLRTVEPRIRIVAAEALQCPTLSSFGYGEHRIEGIGDKHIPWIHNVRNTDLVVAVDDNQTMQLMRLFNEDAGRETLQANGLPDSMVAALEQVGISGICNLVAAIKTAKYYDLGRDDVIFTVLTDSMSLYGSRLRELAKEQGPYSHDRSVADQARWLAGISTDHMRELTYADRKALHRFKYFTWVEQQGKSVEELDRLWDESFWAETFSQEEVDRWDGLIDEFNQAADVFKLL